MWRFLPICMGSVPAVVLVACRRLALPRAGHAGFCHQSRRPTGRADQLGFMAHSRILRTNRRPGGVVNVLLDCMSAQDWLFTCKKVQQVA
ncbi:hypothetical protein BKA66DRAFT_464166 [Pyrenochaeta sp. MPI-SDFR-AT-0127]|nr:hypothetical protein BKA66DRAFT_464166 [Pyrenochaeta sp. MPI-SDFR-AT-0127]